MKVIKQKIAEMILSGIHSIAPDASPASLPTAEDIASMLEYPPNPEMGDLAFRKNRQFRCVGFNFG